MVELPEKIDIVVQTDDVVLVQFTKGEMDPRNLLAFDFEANELWRVDPLKKDEDDQAYPVDGISKKEDKIQLYSWGERYELDPETGETEYLGWVR